MQTASDVTSHLITYIHTTAMSTVEDLSDAAHHAIETMHEATLQDLLKNKNSAVWQLLQERNYALREW